MLGYKATFKDILFHI